MNLAPLNLEHPSESFKKNTPFLLLKSFQQDTIILKKIQKSQRKILYFTIFSKHLKTLKNESHYL